MHLGTAFENSSSDSILRPDARGRTNRELAGSENVSPLRARVEVFLFITIFPSHFSPNVGGTALREKYSTLHSQNPWELKPDLAPQSPGDPTDDRFPMSSSLIEMVGARKV